MVLAALEGRLRHACSGLLQAFTPGVLKTSQFVHLRRFPIRLPVRMVEGPQCHRVANVHRKVLKGHAFKAISPNQRFTEGATLINGKILHRIEVHGKNLFYFFGEGPSTVVMHIHFGMSGRFRVSPLPGPDPTPTTRLQLTNDAQGIVANLSAMTVQHGDLEFYKTQSGKIGPDPLREDADVELVWQKLHNTKKPVGLVLMDQSMVAGIGNIYRAEILFKAGVHPEQPGNTVERDAFERIWRHSVLLLQRGFKEGSILTVDPAEAKILGAPWTRRYIYNHPHCGRCKTAVGVWDMAARTVYACPTCQPLVTGTALTPARSQALGKATPHKKFKSTCAPDGPATAPPQAPPPEAKSLTVAELKSKLMSLGEATKGKKDELLARLASATAKQATKEEGTVAVSPQEGLAAAIEGFDEGEIVKGEGKEDMGAKRKGRGKKQVGQSAPTTVKEEAPVEPRRKRRRGSQTQQPEQEAKVSNLHAANTRPVENSQEVAGKDEVVPPVKQEAASRKPAGRQRRAKGKGKAFDIVLEKEDQEGALVVTTADETAAARPPPGIPAQDHWDGLTVAMLKHELERRGLQTKGIKRTLVARLRDATPMDTTKGPDIQPGTAAIEGIATREEAEEEKQRAGEGKNVEHVAL